MRDRLVYIAVALLISMVATSSATAGAFDKVSPNAAPEWKTGCEARTKDQFGDPKQQYCFLALSNYHIREQLMEDLSYLIRWVALVRIDHQGLRLSTPRKASPLCKTEPKRIAVDGKRIDHLPRPEQIEILSRGKTLVWEEQAEWPACGVAPHGTNLHGIGPAIEKLKEEWSSVAADAWETKVVK